MVNAKEFYENVKLGGKIVSKYLAGTFGGVLLTAMGMAVLAKNGIDISKPMANYTPPSFGIEDYWNNFLKTQSEDPDKLAEDGIKKIMETSSNYDFDSSLLGVAQEIRDIAMKTGSAFKAKTAALNALSDISKRCDFDGTKRRIATIIKEIATSM